MRVRGQVPPPHAGPCMGRYRAGVEHPEVPAAGGPGRLRALVRPRPGGVALDLALLAAFVAVTVALAAGSPLLRADVAVAEWCDAHRPPAAFLVAVTLNYLGQGLPLTLLTFGVSGWRAARWRSARPMLVPVAAYLLTYLSIGPLKLLSARPAPHNTEYAHPERLFVAAGQRSYPSGHVGNALVWYTALAIVLAGVLGPPVLRALRVAPVLVVLATTTYLGYHWLTDGVAGALIGVVLSRLLLRVRWDRIPLVDRIARLGWDRPAGFG
jgi:membrane-associated phospholipid phosphatase